MRFQIVRLWSAGKFFLTRESDCDAIIIFISQCQGETKIIVGKQDFHCDLSFGRFAGKDSLKFLVEITIQCSAGFDTGHFLRIEFVAVHPVDTETLQTSLLVDIANTVSIVKGFKSGNCQIVAPDLFHGSHLFTQRLRSVERENLFITSIQEIMRESTTETLIELWFKFETTRTRRSTYIFRTTGKDRIQFLAISGRHILHIRYVFQSSLYFK